MGLPAPPDWEKTQWPWREPAQFRVGQHQPAVGEAHLREALQIAPQTLGYRAMLAQALREEGHAQEADAEMIAEADVRRLFAQKYTAR
jgi:hypothetical protein